MTSRAEFLNLIEQIYDARRRSSAPDIDRLFHPDIRFRIAGGEQLGYITQKANGKAQFREIIGKLIAEWDLSRFNFRVHALEDDRAAIHRVGTIRNHKTGAEFSTEIVDLITVRDGLVFEFTEFLDTQRIEAASRPLQAELGATTSP